MRRSRQVWLTLHRRIALTAGWVVACVGVLGAVLVVAQPIDRWAHPRLFRATSTPDRAIPYERIRQQLRATLRDDADLTFRPPRDTDDTLWVLVNGRWKGTVYIEPDTGAERGRRSDDDSVVAVLFRLHSSLWFKDVGKAVLACLALVYVAMLTTGLVLWWPRRWPPSWRVAWRQGGTRRLLDLHRKAGAAVGLAIAVSVATGAFMAWRPIGDALSALVGDRKVVPPTLAARESPAIARPSLDTLVARTQARFPDAAIGYVQDPGRSDRPLRIRLKLVDDPHPNGLTSVWIDRRDGTVVRVDRWNTLDFGAKAAAVLYPLHTGELGGPVLEAVACLNGLTLGGLAVTGTWSWWRRRRGRRTVGGRVPRRSAAPRASGA